MHELEPRLPPQDVPTEQAVLGSCLLDKNACLDVLDLLKPSHFYMTAHTKIFTAISELFTADDPVDLITVSEKLTKNGHIEEIGGSYYLSELLNSVVSAANAKHHAKLVLEKALLRDCTVIAQHLDRYAREGTHSAKQLIDGVQKTLFNLQANNERRGFKKFSEIQQGVFEQLETAMARDVAFTGLDCGNAQINAVFGGLQSSDVYLIAGAPSMGKTSLAVDIAVSTALNAKNNVAFFSMEMSETQLTQRIWSRVAAIKGGAFRHPKNFGKENSSKLIRTVEKLQDLGLWIDTSGIVTAEDFRRKSMRVVIEHDVKLICLDYLQLMSGDKSNKSREQEVSALSRTIKQTAQDLNIPIISLSQLSRAVTAYGRSTSMYEPRMSDLRESGAIEADSDSIIFIYRPEYYRKQGMLKANENEDGEYMYRVGNTDTVMTNDKGDLVKLIIAKNRMGAVQDLFCRWDKEYNIFIHVDSDEQDDLGF